MSLASEDVAAGIVTKWNGTTGLAAACPGGLTREEATSEPAANAAKNEPYAVFKITPGEETRHAGGPYIDRQMVVIEIYGEYTAAVAAANLAEPSFSRQTLVLGGSAVFMACLLSKPTEVKKTGKSRDGEDQWVVTISLLVMSQRT